WAIRESPRRTSPLPPLQPGGEGEKRTLPPAPSRKQDGETSGRMAIRPDGHWLNCAAQPAAFQPDEPNSFSDCVWRRVSI
ncbi:MAG TPA: hypothetical protein VHP83_10540, partial [Aggregatilineaceae bacterium]|nr:hypothetical protein [Aggregatilineaceae bacterium]